MTLKRVADEAWGIAERGETKWWHHAVAFPFALVLGACITAWEALAAWCTWGWLAEPAGLPHVPLRVFFALSLVAGVFTYQTPHAEEGPTYTSRMLKRMVLVPLTCLALAYVGRLAFGWWTP